MSSASSRTAVSPALVTAEKPVSARTAKSTATHLRQASRLSQIAPSAGFGQAAYFCKCARSPWKSPVVRNSLKPHRLDTLRTRSSIRVESRRFRSPPSFKENVAAPIFASTSRDPVVSGGFDGERQLQAVAVNSIVRIQRAGRAHQRPHDRHRRHDSEFRRCQSWAELAGVAADVDWYGTPNDTASICSIGNARIAAPPPCLRSGQ